MILFDGENGSERVRHASVLAEIALGKLDLPDANRAVRSTLERKRGLRGVAHVLDAHVRRACCRCDF